MLGESQSLQKRNIRECEIQLDSYMLNHHATTLPNENSNSNSCADQIINMLRNNDHVSQRAIIIKLVLHNDICTCIKEVLSSVPIEDKATFNKIPVKWEDCVPPYAVDEGAFMHHLKQRFTP